MDQNHDVPLRLPEYIKQEIRDNDPEWKKYDDIRRQLVKDSADSALIKQAKSRFNRY
jgi:hypothetical protein